MVEPLVSVCMYCAPCPCLCVCTFDRRRTIVAFFCMCIWPYADYCSILLYVQYYLFVCCAEHFFLLPDIVRSAVARPPLVLVMTPTRELSNQVKAEFAALSQGLSVFCIYGGVPYEPQGMFFFIASVITKYCPSAGLTRFMWKRMFLLVY